LDNAIPGFQKHPQNRVEPIIQEDPWTIWP